MSHNVLVAIDPGRWLNNGHPSFLAWLIEQLELKDGQSVCHVGAGTGYYSAILARMVGEAGRVIAIEVDKVLARRARRTLRDYRQVEVVAGDGFSHNPGRSMRFSSTPASTTFRAFGSTRCGQGAGSSCPLR